jgi:predicted acetyltransferase
VSLAYRSPAEDELRPVLASTYSTFGEEMKDEDFERDRTVMPLDRVLAAWDGEQPVGATASWPFELTLPGGAAPAAGVTWVSVAPSHRRRGVLRELMQRQLDDVHARSEPIAILWASEAPIYGRFGYGIAVPELSMNAERSAFRLRDDPGPSGSVRLVSAEEAATIAPPLYEQLRTQRPGLVKRAESWWREFHLADPEHWRDGAGPKVNAVLELDGEPAGYARYRLKSKWEEKFPRGELRVHDAFATSPEATRELWRFLFGVDLVERVRYSRLDPAWSLFLMVHDPRRLHLVIAEGLWLRFVDLEAALRARTYADGREAVLEVEDAMLERNRGRWAVGAEPGRTQVDADVAVDVADLASAYLGAFSFEQLAASGRARELRPGGLARASAAFATPLPPWCPDGF